MSSLVRTLTVAKPAKRLRFDAGDFALTEKELLFTRLGFTILIFCTVKWETGNLGSVDAEDAVGLARFIDLTFLARIQHMLVWQIVTVLGLGAYVAGRLPALGLLPAVFFVIGIGTLNASQGADNHSTQLCAMILLGQFLVYCIPWQKRAGLGMASWLAPELDVHRRAVYVSLVIFVASYVTSAWVKLDHSDGLWCYKVVPGLALELQKTNMSAYYDTLKPVPQALATALGLINDHPTSARIFLGAGLLIELLAFLALLGRRWAFFMGLAIVALHLSIGHLMQLNFWYHIWAAVIFLLNLPGLARTFRRRTHRTGRVFVLRD